MYRNPQDSERLFMRALEHYDLRRIDDLLTDVIDPNSFFSSGRSPLQHGINTGNPEIIQTILDAGADPNESRTIDLPLIEALRKLRLYSLDPSIIEVLIKNGADPELKDRFGDSAFSYLNELAPDLKPGLYDQLLNILNSFYDDVKDPGL